MSDEHSMSVMVALLPTTTEWSKLSLPHLTVVYAGEKPELKPTDFNYLAKRLSDVASEHYYVELAVNGLDVFGPEGDQVEVLKLRPNPELMAIRQRVVSWDKSTFPFTPHCTIGPIGSFVLGTEIPQTIVFDRIALVWGEEAITFNLKP